jgi:hypothetical protein
MSPKTKKITLEAIYLELTTLRGEFSGFKQEFTGFKQEFNEFKKENKKEHKKLAN